MTGRYVATIAVWPYNGVNQERVGPREQTIAVPAQDFRAATVIAELMAAAIGTNPSVWTCKVTGLREAAHDENPAPRRGDAEAMFAIERIETDRIERAAFQRGKSQAETAAMRVEDKLKLEIERLTFFVQTLMPNSHESEAGLTAAWQAHRKLQIEQFEAV